MTFAFVRKASDKPWITTLMKFQSELADDHAEEKRNLDVAMNGDNAIVGRRIGFIHLVIVSSQLMVWNLNVVKLINTRTSP